VRTSGPAACDKVSNGRNLLPEKAETSEHPAVFASIENSAPFDRSSGAAATTLCSESGAHRGGEGCHTMRRRIPGPGGGAVSSHFRLRFRTGIRTPGRKSAVGGFIRSRALTKGRCPRSASPARVLDSPRTATAAQAVGRLGEPGFVGHDDRPWPRTGRRAVRVAGASSRRYRTCCTARRPNFSLTLRGLRTSW
jgi:hypothetical protein